MTTVRVKPESPELIRAYRRLLLADWEDDFPDRVLRCLWDNILSCDSEIVPLLNPRQSKSLPVDFVNRLIEKLSIASMFVPTPGLPKLPRQFEPQTNDNRIVWQALRLTTYLTLDGNARMVHDGALLRDLRGLAFHAALRVTLPNLTKALVGVRAIVLRAAALYATGWLSIDPAHSRYLMSAIFGAIGNGTRRIQLLEESLRFTPPDDHSYLTKAQEFSMELMDHGRRRQAQQFLESLAAHARPEDREEIEEMKCNILQPSLSAR